MAFLFQLGNVFLIMSDQKKPAEPKPKRYFWRCLLYFLLALLTLLVVSIGGVYQLLSSEGGRNWLIAQINKTEWLHVGALEGDFWNEVILHDVSYRNDSMNVSIDYTRWRWIPANLWHKELSVPELEIRVISVTSKEFSESKKKEKKVLLSSFSLPLKINIDRAVVQTANIDPVILENIHFSLSSTGQVHYLNLYQLNLKSSEMQNEIRGTVQGALALRGDKPFTAKGVVSFVGKFDEHDIGYESNLDGNLNDLHTIGYLFTDDWFVTVDGRFDVLAQDVYSTLHEVTFSMDQVDLNSFFPDLPTSNLSMILTLLPPEKKLAQLSYLQGEIRIDNVAAGTIDAQKIPVSAINGRFEVQEDQIAVYDLMVSALGGAQAVGLGWLRKDNMNLRIQLVGIDLAALQSSLPKTEVSGEARFTGSYDHPQLAIDLNDRILALTAKGDLALDHLESPKKLMIENAVLRYADSEASLRGNYLLQEEKLALTGQFAHLDPAKFGAVSGRLNGEFNIDADLASEAVVDVQFAVRPSVLLNRPLTGKGTLQFVPRRLRNISVQFNSEATELYAEGSLGGADDILNISAVVPDAAQWYGQAHGKVTAQGKLSGAFDDLALTLAADSTQIKVSDVDIERLTVTAESRLSGQFPFLIKANIDSIQGGKLIAQQTELAFDGTIREQSMKLRSSGTLQQKPIDLNVTAKGTLDTNTMRWQGVLSELSLDGVLSAKLQTPMTIDVEGDGFALGTTILSLNNMNVHLETLQWRADYFHTKGELTQIDVAEWLAFTGVKNNNIQSDVILAADWYLTQQAGHREGVANIQRKTGDLKFQIPSQTQWLPLNLGQTALRVTLDGARLNANAVVESNGFATLNATASADIPDGRYDLTMLPFKAHVTGEAPDLSVLTSLSGSGIKATGNLKLDLVHEGTWANGANGGSLIGSALSYHDDLTGIALDEGIMKIDMANNKIVIDELVFKGGRGNMFINGEVDLLTAEPSAQFSITADRMNIIRSQEIFLVVTGRGDLAYDANGISLTGNLKTDYGNIRYRDNSTPSLSDDVVMANEQKRSEGTAALAHVEFDVDLGDNFRIRGYGVDTKVKGALKLRALHNQALNAYGSLQVYDGSYHAYGQKLHIDRGIISFLGPIDNPTLDILAIRENSSVGAGVTVKGTAKRPTVALRSELHMSSNETLSWLLFDHGTDDIDGGDSGILFQVFNAMLAGDDATTLTDSLFGGVIDEINITGMRTNDGQSTQVVTVGKRLTKDISVALEKSFNGLHDAVRLTWRFVRHWSLNGRFGTDDSSASVHYSIRFN